LQPLTYAAPTLVTMVEYVLLPEILSIVVVHLITVDFSVMILIFALHNLVKMEQPVSQPATHITVHALKVLEELPVIM